MSVIGEGTAPHDVPGLSLELILGAASAARPVIQESVAAGDPHAAYGSRAVSA
jgi:hypothetical protein